MELRFLEGNFEHGRFKLQYRDNDEDFKDVPCAKLGPVVEPPRKWTIEQVEAQIRMYCKDYGAAVCIAALFEKAYGMKPRVGLSGAQAEYVDRFVEALP
jgi:hypothetical protein